MIALASVGRQDAALEVYQELRFRLDEQWGMRPGAELAEAHLRVLRQQVPLTGMPAAQAGAARPGARRRPPLYPGSGRVPHFTGREDELATLTGL